MNKNIEHNLENLTREAVPAVELWKRIAHQHDQEQRSARLRLAFSGAAALLIIALFVFSPLRVYAQELWQRIGAITFTSQVGKESEPAISLIEGSPQPWTAPNLSLAEAQQRLGRPVYQPEFLPEGYTLQWRDASGAQDAIRMARAQYAPSSGTGFLTVEQSTAPDGLPAPFGQWPVGEAAIEDVLVRGLPGKYVQGAQILSTAEGRKGANILAWEEDGMTFSLTSDTLERATLLLIAEHLQ